ncbi:MAG: Thioredoxin [Candidatus Bathyarchaeota archaeon BA1]|nr:MAG: Thioredoxin [Candidatus Bathyarchaeota archaeon BA1]
MELKVFTLRTCPNCPAQKRIAQKVAKDFNIKYMEIDIGTPEGRIEGLMHQVISTPSIAISGEVIARGRLVPKRELEDEVKKRLGK